MEDDQSAAANSASCSSKSGMTTRDRRQKKEYLKFSPELIGSKNKKKTLVTAEKKNAAQSDRKAAMQKKINETDGDMFFLQKYDEAQAVPKRVAMEELPTTSNLMELDVFKEEVTEKLNELSERQKTDSEMSQNKFEILEKKIENSKAEIIGELKEAIRENADVRKTHEIVEGVAIRKFEYMRAEHSKSLYSRVKWLSFGYWDEKFHETLYMEKKNEKPVEGVNFITHTDCHNIWKLMITMQKLDETTIPGNQDLSYPNIRSMISQVFRQVRLEKNTTKATTKKVGNDASHGVED